MTDIATRPDNAPDLTESVQQDYFGVEETFQCMLPDGVSYVEHKAFTEGDRRKFLSKTNREVRVSRATQDMHFAMPGGEDRAVLIEIALVGWNLVKKGKPLGFGSGQVKDFLNSAPPHIIDVIEQDIRKHNPWLLTEVTVEDIDKQIKDLEELREQKIKDEEGKGGSSGS